MSDRPIQSGDRVLALDEIEPPYDHIDKCPKSLTKTRRIDGVLYVAGKPPSRHEHTDEVGSEIMFVATAVEEDEAKEVVVSSYGVSIKQKADYLRGPAGRLFKEVCERAGIFPEEHYHTALVKWLLPKAKRNNPAVSILKWGLPILLDEIERVKPKIVVCLGKKVFDLLSDRKLNFKDANGGWFWSSKANAHLYVMQSPYMLVAKPEMHEMFRVDLAEVARKLDVLKYGTIEDKPANIEVIDTWTGLKEWAAMMKEPGTIPTNTAGYRLLSVDGEWHGKQHIDGHLRSLQIAWNDTDAVYFRFRDQTNKFCFDMEGAPDVGCKEAQPSHDAWDDSLRLNPACADRWDIDVDPDFSSISQEKRDEMKLYRQIGKVIASVTDADDVRFVGHHYVADAVWMDRWLGMKVIGKCWMDTEFAQQTVDESSELKLERGIAMRYTSLGRYDLDLVLWKKDNKKLCEDGYGFIPDSIIIPYACNDVLAVYRAVPTIRKLLEAQRLDKYYDEIFNPFVTDVFFTFAQTGLPMDVPLMDELRGLFNWCQRELNKEFRVKITQDAKERLVSKCVEILGLEMGIRAGVQTVNMVVNGDVEKGWEELKSVLPLDKFMVLRPFLDHLASAPEFNLRAPDQMRRWLYAVSGMTPIKSTNNKSRGMPSMDWQKVMELPPDKQKLYMPSVDKQTLMILASHLPLVDDLLDLNVVGNLCKAFLKEPEVYWDEDLEEEVVDEAGLHQWVTSDGTVRGQTSTTETGRPRGWAPNYLNWPSYVNKRIGKAMARMVKQHTEAGTLPDELRKWSSVKDEKDLPSIRSVVKAPPGWCLVESDYQTAEIRGMAYISGDQNLIRLMNESDPEWAFTKDGKKVRVAFADTKLSGIPAHKHNQSYLLKLMEGGKVIATYTEDDLLRDEKTGEVVHCRYDLHWSIAEWTYEMPREEMLDKVHRAAGKVLNFCIAEGQRVLTHRGYVPIEQVLDCDLLWDGVEWVCHAGVRYKGARVTRAYGGIKATDGHEVFDARGRKVRFKEARTQRVELGTAEEPGRRNIRSRFADFLRHGKEEGQRLLLRHDRVRSKAGEGALQHGEEAVGEASVRGGVKVPWCSLRGVEVARNSILGYVSALRAGLARVLAPLQRAWDQGRVRITQGACPMGSGILPCTGLQQHGLRSYRQRWALFEGEPETRTALKKLAESAYYSVGERRPCASVSGGAPGSHLHRAYGFRAIDEIWDRCGGDLGASPEQVERVEPEEEGEVCRVYDIYDAGPRNRFVCEGVLVSNSSAYGASPASLERKIESDTGAKPEEGTGQKGLDAIAARQPRATEFLEEMQSVPSRKGWYRAASGRLRHCVMHDRNSGVNYRIRNSIESAAGRELRNFPMQESVAATAARAGRRLGAVYRNTGMRARVITILYDSVVTLCPLEEREVVSHLHSQLMYHANSWHYEDAHGSRTLSYPIDTDFNYRWSTKPSAAEKALLEDMSWHPTPDRLKWLLGFFPTSEDVGG